ncbi:MAG: alpha/beta hydrolase [Pseudonocardiaceae bacterium]
MSLRRALNRGARASDHTVRYGEGSEHVIELWRPKGAPGFPTVVVIHGGFWAARYDRAHIRPLCAALADHGFVAAALEYHRVGQPRGGWPGTFQDVADGLDALPNLTAGLLDDDRTVLVGHSAGGHLALWAALRRQLPLGSAGRRAERLPITGVVALAGISDLHEAHRLDLGAGAVERLLGGGPMQYAARYATADPARLLPLESPCVLLHGSADDHVPFQISQRFHDLAIAGGGREITLTRLPGTGHFDVIDPASTAFPAVLDAINTVSRIDNSR